MTTLPNIILILFAVILELVLKEFKGFSNGLIIYSRLCEYKILSVFYHSLLGPLVILLYLFVILPKLFIVYKTNPILSQAINILI